MTSYARCCPTPFGSGLNIRQIRLPRNVVFYTPAFHSQIWRNIASPTHSQEEYRCLKLLISASVSLSYTTSQVSINHHQRLRQAYLLPLPMTFYHRNPRTPFRSRFAHPGLDNDLSMGSSGSTPAAEPESASTPTSDSPTNSPYFPNAYDVLKVRRMLQHAVRDNPTTPDGLPTELVDIIIDTAEYWPSVEVKMQEKVVAKKIHGEDREYAMVINQDRDRECLRTGPLCYTVSFFFLEEHLTETT